MINDNDIKVVIRPATLDDATILYEWRNDQTVRKASRNQDLFDLSSHIAWLKKSLSNAKRGLFIAECNSKPVGTARYDIVNGWYELSWTVAPDARRQGIGKKMVKLLIDILPGPFYADIKKNNQPSISIAESIGMKMEHSTEDILHYTKGNT